MTSVAVIVAARNAAETIGAAVRSALAEPEVARVIVVDDASSDDTGLAAQREDDGTGRLHLLRFETNRGPSGARNAAFAEVEEEFVAVLDADDRFLPGRIARLLDALPFEMAADNMVFVREDSAPARDPALLERTLDALEPARNAPEGLTLAEFVEGNVTRPGRPRAELGFLKPILRTASLRTMEGPWDETLRLGEDYDLYVRLLAAGARFRLVPACGYLALERAASLSGRHSVRDLERFAAIDQRLLRRDDLPADARRAIERHGLQSRARFEHRRFLEMKSAEGLAAAAASLLAQPRAWFGVTAGVARDKLRGLARRAPSAGEVRLLFGADGTMPVPPHSPGGHDTDTPAGKQTR